MKNLYLLDTNICVFFLRHNTQIAEKLESVGIENCCLSEITVAELLYGGFCTKDSEESLRIIAEFCKNFTIIPLGDALWEFARQKYLLRKRGCLIEDMDLLIGSTAISNDYILVSDNVKHFDRLDGIRLENWIQR